MVSSVPPSGPGSTGQPQQPSSTGGIPAAALAGVKVKPGDEYLLDTAWGKFIERMPGAPTDKVELIKMIKASMQQYCNQVRIQMQDEDRRAREAAAKLKRVAEGKDPDA